MMGKLWALSKGMLQMLREDGSLADVSDSFPLMTDEQLMKAYDCMVRARAADEWGISLNRQGRMPTYVTSIGQEANSVGALLALRQDDWFVQAYRELGGLLVRGIPLKQIYQYWYGNEQGSNLDPERYHTMPVSVPVSSQCLHGVGIAFAQRYLGTDRVVITYLGDGATSEGDFHEAMNFAGNWNIGVIFFVQNNQYAISLPRAKQTATKTIAEKASAYGFEGMQVDGNDVQAVFTAVSLAADKARSGGGPTLIEGVTYRIAPHTTSDDPNRYRDPAEVEAWKKRDPIIRLERLLLKRKILSGTDPAVISARAMEEAKAQFREAESVPDPEVEETFRYMYERMPAQLAKQLNRRTELSKE
jgi:pyruvate dehydrogenase E1 component alpha subunit